MGYYTSNILSSSTCIVYTQMKNENKNPNLCNDYIKAVSTKLCGYIPTTVTKNITGSNWKKNIGIGEICRIREDNK